MGCYRRDACRSAASLLAIIQYWAIEANLLTSFEGSYEICATVLLQARGSKHGTLKIEWVFA